MSATFHSGDSLSIIRKRIKSKSINLIYMNPPFGTTHNKWDEKLDWASLFKEFFRVLKDDGMLVIHCSVPFNYTLIRIKEPNYSWYWKKEAITNPLIAKVQPLRNTEEILVWKNKKNTYYPQRVGNEIRTNPSMGSMGTYYGTQVVSKEKSIVVGKYQTHHIEMKRHIDGFSTRPREMIELFIKSYTKSGDIILDPSCYMGVCGLISKELGRNWIGIDKHFLPTKLMV